jgi:DNA-binding LytR/AlgR family response regulator
MSTKLNALIVDDEDSARKLLAKLLEELQCFNEVRLSKSVLSAANELTRFDPDVIFLDIKMPGKDGFSLLNDLPENEKRPAIVIVTAYDSFAIKAIKTHAFDYLLKPVNRKELKSCVQKLIEMKEAVPAEKTAIKDLTDKIPRIHVNTRSGTVFINPATVLYCKADGNYTTIVTSDRQHLCSMNLGKVEELLSSSGFIRVGRSYLINLEYITILDRKDSSIVLERNGIPVKVKIPRHHLKDLESI